MISLRQQTGVLSRFFKDKPTEDPLFGRAVLSTKDILGPELPCLEREGGALILDDMEQDSNDITKAVLLVGIKESRWSSKSNPGENDSWICYTVDNSGETRGMSRANPKAEVARKHGTFILMSHTPGYVSHCY